MVESALSRSTRRVLAAVWPSHSAEAQSSQNERLSSNRYLSKSFHLVAGMLLTVAMLRFLGLSVRTQ